jgi:hypothetical protein
MAHLTAVAAFGEELREWINTSPQKYALEARPQRWGMLCSALDVLDDTELAILAFYDGEREDAWEGHRYLGLYGVLQAAFLQQDALETIHRALGYPFEAGAALEAIRSTRNDAVGHPTFRNHGASFHFITRISLGHEGFHMWDMDRKGEMNERWINLVQLVQDQESAVASHLAVLLGHLSKYGARDV